MVLDTSSSMMYKESGPVSKLEYGAYLAGALHYMMAKQKDATGLICFSETVHTILPPKSTQRYVRELLMTLERIVAEGKENKDAKTAAASAIDEIAERISRRSLVVLITDLFENISKHDDLIKSLRHLRYRGHEVLVFHILESKTEREFDFPDVPMLFRDMETGEQVSLQPSQLKENYREAVKVFSGAIQTSVHRVQHRLCGARHVRTL